MMQVVKMIVTVIFLVSCVFGQVYGFPISLGIGELPLWGAPAIVKFNSTAFIAIGSTDDSLYCIGLNGEMADGFPIAMPGPIRSKVAWELYDDHIFIVAITTDGYLCLVDWDGTSASLVYTIDLGSSANYISPVLDDADNDGELEIYSAIDTTLYCYSIYGDFIWQAEFYSTTGSAVATPAVGDVDGDGEGEIIVEGYDALFAFNADGTMLDGFPAELDADVAFSYSAPFLWDYDDDGNFEIFCGAHQIAGAEYGLIYKVEADSASLESPIYTVPSAYGTWVYSSAAMGDVNGNYSYDITFGSVNGTVFGIDGDGAIESFGGVALHMPMGHIYGGILLCDIDTTAGPEYIFQMVQEEDEKSYLVVMDPGAEYIDSFPDTMEQHSSGILTPAVFVLSDSTYIVAATADGELYLWSVANSPLPGYAHWTELFGDRRNRSIAIPDAPIIEVQQQDSSGYLLTWNTSDCRDFARYLVYLSPDSAGKTAELITSIYNVTDTSFVYESSVAPESLWFFVLVEDSFGRTSQRSVPKSPFDTTKVMTKAFLPAMTKMNVCPSPFNSACWIYVQGAVQIDVLSIDGRMVRSIRTSLAENISSSHTRSGVSVAVLRADDDLPAGLLILHAKDAKNRTIATGKAIFTP